MNKILNLGRYVFPLSFTLYLVLHLAKPTVGASLVPEYMPYRYFWNYFTAGCIFLFIISAVTGRYDRLAYLLMSFYVLLMAFLVHLSRAIDIIPITNVMAGTLAREKELEMINFFRNIMITGALLGFAKYVARDHRMKIVFSP
ncbi:MAG: hypothetical protein J0L80_01010 [Chitinophagales bacterium]|nr:hypothetical protein [Chitinophagales bacterium]